MSDADRTDLTRVETLFHAALERPEDEREAFLREQVGSSPEALVELRSLLAAHGRAPAALETPAWALAETEMEALFEAAEAPALESMERGTRLGRYEIRRRLGEGGMGSVYLALQHEPLRRLVALKLIKPGMDTREVVRRFASERQALARLNHPGIAAVHDAGVSEHGRPYFVMEYVPGRRVTEWCDERKLGLRERVELFLDVCRAVQHAHAQGIVHRDLKPSNVLVRDQDGVALPKIIDFGVAKATAGPGGRSTIGTRRGQLLGTPGYMSPEQAGAVNASLDARSDVYSLGVLLYELLTGVLPLDRRALQSARWLDRLREAPVSASLRVRRLGRRAARRAQRRDASVRGLTAALSGDMDAILRRALQPEPEARYAAVADLAADLRAWLRGRRVRAPRAPVVGAGARRALRRSLPVVAGLALGALGLALWQLPDGAGSGAEDASQLSAELSPPSVAQLDSQLAPGPATPSSSAACAVTGWDAELAPAELAQRLLVLNDDALPLAPGSALRLVGRAQRDGQDVLLVSAASRRHEGPLVGLLLGQLEAQPHDGHEHLRPGVEPLGVGALGLAMGRGGISAGLRADPDATLRPGEPLGLSELPGRLTAHDGAGPLIGFVAQAAPAASARVDVWVQPQQTLNVPSTTLVLAAPPRGPRGGSSTPDAVASGKPPGRSNAGRSSPRPSQPAAEPDADAPLTWLTAPGGGAASAPGLGNAQPQPLLLAEDLPGSTDGFVPEIDPLPKDVGGTLDPEQKNDRAAKHSSNVDEDPAAKLALSPNGPPQGPDARIGTDAETSITLSPKEAGVARSEELVELRWIDLDGDGRLDLLRRGSLEPLQLFVQVRPGLFEDRSLQTNLGDFPRSSAEQFVDLDGDGLLDLIGIDEGSWLVVWLGEGDGMFRPATRWLGLTSQAVTELVLIDLDGDELLDLQIRHESAERLDLTLLLNRVTYFQRWEIELPPAPDLTPGFPTQPASPGGAPGHDHR